MKHTKSQQKAVTLSEARARASLTQQQLEALSGVDRTRISKLESQDDPGVMLDTYEKLDGALRKVGALKPNEKLVFGSREKAVA